MAVFRKILAKIILFIGIALIAVIAVPAALLFGAILIIWAATDFLVEKIK